jgi:hypothetical protein
VKGRICRSVFYLLTLGLMAYAQFADAQVVRLREGGGGGAASAVTPGSTTVTGCQNLVLYGDNSSLLNCEAALGYVSSTNTLTADTVTVATQVIVPAGTAGAGSSIFFSNDDNTGIFSPAAANIGVVTNGTERFRFGSGGILSVASGVNLGTSVAAPDAAIVRHAANVAAVTNASTSTRFLLGGGAAVASAATLPVPTGNVFHVTGTTNITGGITSTNLGTGVQITLIFDGILTVSSGGNLIIVGGTFATTANDTLTLVYDGTNWFEIARTVL